MHTTNAYTDRLQLAIHTQVKQVHISINKLCGRPVLYAPAPAS